jgi:hypothetical protein
VINVGGKLVRQPVSLGVGRARASRIVEKISVASSEFSSAAQQVVVLPRVFATRNLSPDVPITGA